MSDENLTFYTDLEPVAQFDRIFEADRYKPVPDSWFVAVTDVVNSTTAIREGRYKHVNVAGSLGAMALANESDGLDFPFAFGGDGMVMVLPPSLKAMTRSVLADVRKRVLESFGLELRAGIVPVKSIRKVGGELTVARMRVSDNYSQALFGGNGIRAADLLVKDKRTSHRFLIPEDEPITKEADLSGFSCRWEDIPSQKGETVSLIVRVRDRTREQESLRKVMDTIERVLGADGDYHPLSADAMKMGNRKVRSVEAAAVSGRTHGLLFEASLATIRVEMWLTSLLVRLKIPFRRGRKRLDQVREENVLSSDYRKYDGTLKMVVGVTPRSRKMLVTLLDEMHQAGTIFYGLHVSDRALMTCLIHFESGNEVHFVDAADGGYALAALAMKEQVRAGQSHR